MTTATLEAAKQHAREALERRRDELIEVSHAIHGRPETAFEEQFAAEQGQLILHSKRHLHVEHRLL